MNRLLTAATALALALSSYAWAAGPEGLLGKALPQAPKGSAKPASPGLSKAAGGMDRNVGRYADALGKLQADSQAATRGANESRVYAQASPSVVLVVTKDGLGSGVLISADGQILTNLHVVGDEEVVGVIFKPVVEGAKVGTADVITARVIRRDGVADLALIKARDVPPGHGPLKLAGGPPPAVGADVHAIGHPTGEAWSYTKGVVSQVRQDYQWAADDKIPHTATVIQTQTPINPGNSGGPLLNDGLEVVGVNSFTEEGEGLNFAVSAKDATAMLALTADRAAPKPPECEIQEMGKKRSEHPKGEMTILDTDCDGVSDVVALVPDKKRDPLMFMGDKNQDGKIDTVIIDEGRDGKFDLAMYDTDGDGKFDLEGYYRDGEDEPYRYERVKN